jgi:hypothetical protein
MAIASRLKRPVARQQTTLATTLQLLRFDVQRSLGMRRWWFIVPIFGIMGWIFADMLKYDYTSAGLPQLRPMNIWDVLPRFFAPGWVSTLLLGGGFVVLVGDGFLRDREQNTLALSIARVPSRTAWWAAKLGSLGVLALCYVALVTVAVLVGSAFSVPVALSDSPQSLIPTTGHDGWYFRLMNVPMPVFTLLMAIYSAFTLWVLGAVVVTASVIKQHIAVPLAIVVLWVLVGRTLDGVLPPQMVYAKLLYLPYFLGYDKHLEYSSMETLVQMPLVPFLVIALVILATAFVLGAWRLRRIDV